MALLISTHSPLVFVAPPILSVHSANVHIARFTDLPSLHPTIVTKYLDPVEQVAFERDHAVFDQNDQPLAGLHHELQDMAKQFVVRMNRDTFYSVGIVELSKGDVYVNIPNKSDRYVSMQVVDENHETWPMVYGSGRHKVTAKTDYAFIVVRSLDDNARKNITVESPSAVPFVAKEWDMDSFKKVDSAGNADFADGYNQSKAFGNVESGQTDYFRYVGAAGGWGGAMVEDNIYQTTPYKPNNACYSLTFPDSEDKYFWSATVYNGDGRMFNDNANISSETNSEKNKDGSYTLHFGCKGIWIT